MNGKTTFEAAGEAMIAGAEGEMIIADAISREVKRLFRKLFGAAKGHQLAAK